MSSKCNCGSACACGSDCKCGAYPDIEKSTAATVVVGGVAPKTVYSEGLETTSEGGNACKCGANCKCDPCNC